MSLKGDTCKLDFRSSIENDVYVIDYVCTKFKDTSRCSCS
jgi:hypothetical protein